MLRITAILAFLSFSPLYAPWFSYIDIHYLNISQKIIKTLRTHNPDSIKLHLIVEKLKFIWPPKSTLGVGVIRKHSFSRPDLQEKKKINKEENIDPSKWREYRVKESILKKKFLIWSRQQKGSGTGSSQECEALQIPRISVRRTQTQSRDKNSFLKNWLSPC